MTISSHPFLFIYKNKKKRIKIYCFIFFFHTQNVAGIILCMHTANKRWCYIVMLSLIGWTHINCVPIVTVSQRNLHPCQITAANSNISPFYVFQSQFGNIRVPIKRYEEIAEEYHVNLKQIINVISIFWSHYLHIIFENKQVFFPFYTRDMG